MSNQNPEEGKVPQEPPLVDPQPTNLVQDLLNKVLNNKIQLSSVNPDDVFNKLMGPDILEQFWVIQCKNGGLATTTVKTREGDFPGILAFEESIDAVRYMDYSPTVTNFEYNNTNLSSIRDRIYNLRKDPHSSILGIVFVEDSRKGGKTTCYYV